MTSRVIDIDITVPRGDKTVSARFQSQDGITVLFGASGAGKTTVLEAIAGMARPIAGHIIISGRTLFDSARRIDLPLRARRIGYVPQDLLLFPHLSVAAQLRFGARRGGPDIADIAAACEIDGLLQRRPGALSGGEQRRVALARALMTGPDLLALDEPLAGLDPPRRQRLLTIIERLRQAGGPPILYVGHFAEEAVRLADTAVMMAQGHVVAAGTAETVFADHRAQAHFGLFDQGAVLAGTVAAPDQPGLSRIAVAGGALLIAGPPPGALGERVRLRILARDVAIARTAPQDTSILNVIPATITTLTASAGDVMVDMRLGNGQGTALSARITAISAQRLGLNRGDRVYALVKAVAVARRH